MSNTLGYGLSSMAYIYHARGEWQAAQEWARPAWPLRPRWACLILSHKKLYQVRFSARCARPLRRGHHEMRQGLAAQRATAGKGSSSCGWPYKLKHISRQDSSRKAGPRWRRH